MKNTILALVCLLIFNTWSQAQCIPDTSITHNVPGAYPDTIQNLPHAIVGVQFDTDIQVKVWTDVYTTVSGFPVHACFDSVVVMSVTGLPVGYSSLCMPASCSFPGGGNGCIHLTGPPPVLADVGMVYPIDVSIRAFVVVCGGTLHAIRDTIIHGYKIIIDNNIGVQNLSAPVLDILQNVPNPFHGNSEISFTSSKNETLSFKVSDVLGKVIYARTIVARKGLNKIILSGKDFETGIYLYSISNSGSTITRRMIVSNE